MDATEVGVIAAFTAGLLSFLSPCVLPLVPPYLCFIGGTAAETALFAPAGAEEADRAEAARRTRRVVLAAACFVLGFSTVFVLMGAGATIAGRWLAQHIEALGQIAGVTIIVLGLHFAGVFRLAPLARDLRVHLATRPAGLAGAYLVGLAFAFGWTPCVGPVLAAILFVAGSGTQAWHGAALLAAFAAGLGVPFLLAALAAGRFLAFSRRWRHHLGKVERVTGVVLVVTGGVFLGGGMSEVSQWLWEHLPVLGDIG